MDEWFKVGIVWMLVWMRMPMCVCDWEREKNCCREEEYTGEKWGDP